MTYRKSAPKERKPLELILLRHSPLGLVYGIFLASAAVVAGITYGSVEIDCVRPTAGEPASCTAHTSGFQHQSVDPFTLGPNTIVSTTVRGHKSSARAGIEMPDGVLYGPAINEAFARQTANDAERFREDTARLEWRVSHTNALGSLCAALVGLVLIAVTRYKRRPRELVVDPNEGTVTSGKRVWSLASVRNVIVVPYPKSAYAVLSFELDGKTEEVATGDPSSANAARAVLERLVKESRK